MNPSSQKSRKVDFFGINVGHVAGALVWLATVIWGYSDLNTRVKTLETVSVARGVIIESIRTEKSTESKDLQAQIALLNAKLGTMGNDIDWIKKNLK